MDQAPGQQPPPQDNDSEDRPQPKRQRPATLPTMPTPLPAAAIPTQEQLRVQGVGDQVEGSIQLQQLQSQQHQGGVPGQHAGGGPAGSDSWSLHNLGDWRARAFATNEALVQQQQRELRRLLLQNSSALSPTKKKKGGGGPGSET